MTPLRFAAGLLSIAGLLASSGARADDVDYRTGGKRFAETWHAFYDLADHAPEIDDPLIAAGPRMVPAICEAVAHRDMKFRRHAIAALGYIGDRRALQALQTILDDGTEAEQARGDALISIYRIDRALGTRNARQYRHADAFVAHVSEAILRNDAWLLAPSEEQGPFQE